MLRSIVKRHLSKSFSSRIRIDSGIALIVLCLMFAFPPWISILDLGDNGFETKFIGYRFVGYDMTSGPNDYWRHDIDFPRLSAQVVAVFSFFGGCLLLSCKDSENNIR